MTVLPTRLLRLVAKRRIWVFVAALVFSVDVFLVRVSKDDEVIRSFLSVQVEDKSTPRILMPLRSPFPAVTVGTVIRGDELGKHDSDRALVTFYSLHNLAKHFGHAQVVVLVDKIDFCDRFPPTVKGVRCVSISHCINAEYAAPTMDCIFRSLLSEAPTELVGFVNGDIVTFRSLAESLAISALNLENFLMVGKRFTFKVTPTIPENLNEIDSLEILTRSLKPDNGYAIDYFFARRSHALKIIERFPAFVVGTYRWDNVLLSLFYKSGDCVVIDATQAAPVLHIASSPATRHVARPAAIYNQALATFCSGDDYIAGSIDYADLIIRQVGVTEFQMFPQAPQIQILRCSLLNGILVSPDSVPKPVRNWLNKVKHGVPRDVGVEAFVDENIRIDLRRMPRFHFLAQEAERLFVYYEPTIMNFIFTLGQPAGSSCLALSKFVNLKP